MENRVSRLEEFATKVLPAVKDNDFELNSIFDYAVEHFKEHRLSRWEDLARLLGLTMAEMDYLFFRDRISGRFSLDVEKKEVIDRMLEFIAKRRS